MWISFQFDLCCWSNDFFSRLRVMYFLFSTKLRWFFNSGRGNWEKLIKNFINLRGAIDEFFTMLNLGCWIYRFFVSQSSVGSTTVSSISLSFRGRSIRWSISRISRCRYCRRWLLWCCILWLLSWWLLICVYVYRCWRRDAVDVIVSRTGSCCIVVSVSCEKLKDDLNFKRSKMMDLNFIDLG